jgi:hypothetical protein
MDTLKFVTIELSYVIPLYFDQENNDSLTDLLSKYATYEPQLLDRIQFVLVDDCSPVPVKLRADLNLNILLLRIRDDIPWNQPGERNLGVVYSRSDKVLATDLDHEFSEPTLQDIVRLPKLGRKMCRLRRRDTDGAFIRPHPNTFVMSRGRFLELFGVDEEFSGAYGCDDGMFWRWQRYNGSRFTCLKKKYVSQCRRIDRVNSYHSLERDNARNAILDKRKKREWEKWGPRGGHSRKFLCFTWDVIEDRERTGMTWQAPENRLWKKLWFLRQLFGY